ncbi:squalene/phytoene synthase family protein [Halorussus limi]|uniref:Squalene/phytoene synthase family protein n=1 Tax=Halorussus limi TaxID=2938695 RepID=A0A8U0HST0_9EURY|nr:phytoene/squalene synthase family protein [Halorussus limi]UPV74172.1 squalene/phytoene synthase family protein [Halorussus limi]
MDTEPPTERLADSDIDWCFDAVQGVSRTFAITIDVLEEPMASYICVGYLLCRVADTVEDAGHIPPDEQSRLLALYDRALDPEDSTGIEEFRREVGPWLPENAEEVSADEVGDEADWEVVARSPRVVATFRSLGEDAQSAIYPPVSELVTGMAEFVDRYADDGGLRIGTIDELEEYCWYAAGTVGELITNLLAQDVDDRRAEIMRANARGFALLLQLVNVAKDVSDDFREENNVYLPASWLRERGVSPANVTDPENHTAVAGVIQRVTRHARGYMDDAQRYLEALPESQGNTVEAWAIPFLLAVGTSRELLERPEDVVEEGGVKVSRAEVMGLIQLFKSGNVERERIGELRSQLEDEPFSSS